MTKLTIELEDELAREVEASAQREHKSVSEWVNDWMKREATGAVALAAMEARAHANGYPPNWLALFGSLADDESFAGPSRGPTRPIETLNGD